MNTWFENSNYLETPRYNKTVEFCKAMDSASDQVFYTQFGTSPQGRALPLLIVDKNHNFDPVKVRKSGNLVLLIQACIHAGEPDGKDAGLMLIRDLVINKMYPELLNHVTIVFIPIYNVDGHERFGKYNRINQNGPEEMGWRVNAQNLNLNRDYLKADAPETQAWLKLFNLWLPDFFIDCHTTDGADYQYALTYGAEIYGNLDSNITNWMKNDFIPVINKKVENEGYPIFPYIAFRNWGDPRSGLRTWVSAPRFSMGYTAIQNRAGVLIETHMLKNYKIRVYSTYTYLKNSLDLLSKNYKSILKLNNDADLLTCSSEFRKSTYPLKFSSMPDSEIVDFKGFKYSVSKSDISGGDWIKYSDTPYTYRIPYFDKQKASESANLPFAYIIPAEWADLVKLLELHGINFFRLKDSVSLKVKSYHFSKLKWQTESYEGQHPIISFNKDEIEIYQTYFAGSIVVPMSQRTAKVIAHILEPSAPDSYLNWGGFDAIFEQKEYSESYVMERTARDMLQNNPDLLKEYKAKMLNDQSFATNSGLILNWFYSKSNYWDKSLNIYPIGRILNSDNFNKLPIK